MKRLLHACNTLILIAVLAFFLATQLASGPAVDPGPEAGMSGRTLYRVAQLRHKVSVWARHRGGMVMDSHGREVRDAAFAWLSLNVLVILAGWMWPKRPGDKISLEVNGGRVSIAVRALEDSLHRILRNDVNVKDARVKVIPERGRVRVQAALTLIENANLPAMEEAILERLRHHFEVIFPADEPVEYEVDIQKLRASGHTVPGFEVAPRTPQPPRPSPDAVDQPRYPDIEPQG